MKNIVISGGVGAILALIASHFFWGGSITQAAANQPVALKNFSVNQARFDESEGKEPDPQIPLSWKLIAVSNGSAVNGQNLYFQDPTGQVYIFHGFTDGPKFILYKQVDALPQGN